MPKRSLEDNGRIVTTGGTGYVPPVDYSAIADRLNNLFGYSLSYLKNKLFGYGDGTFINLSDKKVSTINKNTKGVKTILANDFVEKNKNTIRKKKDFINTTDTLLGDKKIPLSRIRTFYGVENGKLKAGDLSTFNDETVVVPNRIKTTARLVKVLPHVRKGDKWYAKWYTNEDEEIIDKYNKSKGYTSTSIIKLKPSSILKTAEGNNAIDSLLTNYQRGITENGDTIVLPYLNATPKVLFANEKGNAAFVSNLQNAENVSKLNAFLSQYPSYPIMVDNGRYSFYMDNNPNVDMYSGLNNPNDMFIIGTK